MAKVIERKRGRTKGALRIASTGLVKGLTNATGTKSVTVPLREVTVGKKTYTDEATLTIPKGAAVVPFALTEGMSTDENAREQIRNGGKDAVAEGWAAPKGYSVVVESFSAALDDGSEGVVFVLKLHKGKGDA